MPNNARQKKERTHASRAADVLGTPDGSGCTGCSRCPELGLGERARGECVFMTLLINSPPAVKNHAQTDNKNKYLTVSQLCRLKMDFTLKDTADPGEGFNGIFEF